MGIADIMAANARAIADATAKAKADADAKAKATTPAKTVAPAKTTSTTTKTTTTTPSIVLPSDYYSMTNQQKGQYEAEKGITYIRHNGVNYAEPYAKVIQLNKAIEGYNQNPNPEVLASIEKNASSIGVELVSTPRTPQPPSEPSSGRIGLTEIALRPGRVILTPEQEIKQDYSTMSDPAAIVRNALATFLSAPVRVMGGLYTDISNFITGKPSTGATANAYSSGINPNQPNVPSKQVAEWEYGIKQEPDPFKKWVNVQIPAYENVILPVAAPYFLGGVLGGFAATKIGQTAAFTIKGLRVTPALTLNTGVGTIFGAGMAKSGVEAYKGGTIKEWAAMNTILLPTFLIPFKAGYNTGGGYVQRTGAMSTLSDATQRTQQKAIYDMMKTTERLHEPYLDQKPYDITQVKNPSPPYATGKFLTSFSSKLIRKPAIGGSAAMDIQMGEFYRKGGYPARILEIARERQSQTMQPDMRNVPLKLSGTPGDIDILLGGKLATTKMAEKWGGELDTHVHVSKPGTEYWGGYSTKPFTKSFVSFTGEPVSVKTLSVREQFLRYGHSVLPSNIETKSYRAYKDVPGFYDTYDVLQFQKGGTKLNEAMDRFLNPEGYKALRVTIGEKFVKGIGGARKINEDWSYGSSKLGYVPSYKSTPTINNLLYRTDGYTKTNILSTSYVNKGFDYQPSYILKKDYKVYTPTPPPTYIPAIKTDYGYTPTKSTYTPSYEPPYTPPTYTPKYEPPYEPPYIPPTYVPDYKPPYTPPTYTPKYEPPYKPPPYKPPYYPDDKIPPPTNKIKYPSINMEKEIKESLKGYNVFIKERHYFKGKKKKPTSWFKASKYPLTKEQALALGSTAVNETAAASFKIVPTEGQPKNLGFSVDSWGNLSGNFYMKGNTFIEKTPYRINTQGEIKGISALGWLAQRQRPYQSPTKIRYTPTTNAKPMAIPKPISINININKIMKGWKL